MEERGEANVIMSANQQQLCPKWSPVAHELYLM